MIFDLFPTAVFRDANTFLISEARILFNKSERFLKQAEGGVMTTLGGYSPGKSKTLFNIDGHPEGSRLKKYFEVSTFNFLNELKYKTENKKVEVSNVWFNLMVNGTSHNKHSHYGYTFSGVYYIECADNDAICFHHPTFFKACIEDREEHTTNNSDKWWMPVRPGDLIMFPSYLEHEVLKLDVEVQRKSVAFDVVVYN